MYRFTTASTHTEAQHDQRLGCVSTPFTGQLLIGEDGCIFVTGSTPTGISIWEMPLLKPLTPSGTENEERK